MSSRPVVQDEPLWETLGTHTGEQWDTEQVSEVAPGICAVDHRRTNVSKGSGNLKVTSTTARTGLPHANPLEPTVLNKSPSSYHMPRWTGGLDSWIS